MLFFNQSMFVDFVFKRNVDFTLANNLMFFSSLYVIDFRIRT